MFHRTFFEMYEKWPNVCNVRKIFFSKNSTVITVYVDQQKNHCNNDNEESIFPVWR